MTASEPRTTYLPSGLPVPAAAADGLDAPFWEAARRHELVVQRCGRCGTFQFPPEWLCHACRSFEVGWQAVDGRGRIFSWERVWHPVHPALEGTGPYLVVLVALSEAGGVRMLGNLLGNPMQDVAIGAEVEAVFEDHPGDTVTLVQWRTVPAQDRVAQN